jgi:hypothetical protein
MSTLPPDNNPPPASPTLDYAVAGAGIACPRCGRFGARPVKFTWWGGLVGPKLLNHTKCDACRFTFNSKTGRSNKVAIVVYTSVGFIAGVAIVVALRLLG